LPRDSLTFPCRILFALRPVSLFTVSVTSSAIDQPTYLAVKPSRQFPFLARHPWVHLSSLAQDGADLAVGQVVDLTGPDGQWIARGLVNPHSRLRIRLYSWNRDQTLGEEFIQRRIDQAIARRVLVGLAPQAGAQRLVFSESDGLSGLVVDRYANFLSVQITAGGLDRFRDCILDHLQSVLQPSGICLRVDEKTSSHEAIAQADQWVRGAEPEGPLTFLQNGLRWNVDLLTGQKTGTYLDQAANHAAAAHYLRGRRVLDVCCYAGGFGLVAAAAGASEVVGIDGSQKALDAAEENARMNDITNIRFIKTDCFDYLHQAAQQGETFDAVVLDPPRFAGSRHQLDAALRAYQKLNSAAVQLLPPGGVLVSNSCSGRVSRSDFLNVLSEVARRKARQISILESRGAAPDHPISVSCPETDYLKCMICEVNQ
jgi:23S rRNA (cytosine1962-C5)-methyltransferase